MIHRLFTLLILVVLAVSGPGYGMAAGASMAPAASAEHAIADNHAGPHEQGAGSPACDHAAAETCLEADAPPCPLNHTGCDVAGCAICFMLVIETVVPDLRRISLSTAPQLPFTSALHDQFYTPPIPPP